HVEDAVLVLGAPVVGAEKVRKSRSPTLSTVLYLESSRPLVVVLVREQTGVLHLLVVRVLRVTDDVDLVFLNHVFIAFQESVRVVSSDSAALHQSEERELEVVPRPFSPAGDMAVEQILASLHAAGPEVSARRDDLELLHHPDQVFTFIRD